MTVRGKTCLHSRNTMYRGWTLCESKRMETTSCWQNWRQRTKCRGIMAKPDGQTIYTQGSRTASWYISFWHSLYRESGIKRKEVQYNVLEEGRRASEILPIRVPPQITDSLFIIICVWSFFLSPKRYFKVLLTIPFVLSALWSCQ